MERQSTAIRLVSRYSATPSVKHQCHFTSMVDRPTAWCCPLATSWPWPAGVNTTRRLVADRSLSCHVLTARKSTASVYLSLEHRRSDLPAYPVIRLSPAAVTSPPSASVTRKMAFYFRLKICDPKTVARISI